MSGFFPCGRGLSLAASAVLALVAGTLAAIAGTPAERRVEMAQSAISLHPEKVESHNALALALAQRARETSDPGFYEQAAAALLKSFELTPDNLEGRKIEAWITLGQHEFARALELARALQKRAPDDIFIYGLLTDACVETGRYEEAEKAAQWALDLRPGEISALTRAAYLRELFGDIDGAIELMHSAYTKTNPGEVEDRAWILAQVAHLHLLKGTIDYAEMSAQEALRLFPGYHYALGQLVKIRTAQKRPEQAIEVARALCDGAPHAENFYVLGEALARSGKKAEAAKIFAEFERKAIAEAAQADNANRELIFYYADRAAKPREALRIARSEIARRQDVFSLDAFAWALHRNGKNAEAREKIEQALAVGVRDPNFAYHAGMIAAELGLKGEAKGYLRKALDENASPEIARLARRRLATWAAR